MTCLVLALLLQVPADARLSGTSMQALLDSGPNFVAALATDTTANHGSNAKYWGLWLGDPGADGRQATAIDSNSPAWYKPLDFWKEEHDLIMPNPVPMPAGSYKVYGDRTQGGAKTLTVDAQGNWQLEAGVTIDDVTHHPCKAYRYMGESGSSCRANNQQACTSDGSPVEYKVLIVESQDVGHMDPNNEDMLLPPSS